MMAVIIRIIVQSEPKFQPKDQVGDKKIQIDNNAITAYGKTINDLNISPTGGHSNLCSIKRCQLMIYCHFNSHRHCACIVSEDFFCEIDQVIFKSSSSRH